MIKTIALVIAALVAAVLIYATTKPDTLRVAREISIKAPPEKIFPLINDLPSWRQWSAYETKDPAMKRTFGAIAAGPGATYGWEGNSDVGQGNMTISANTPPTSVTIQLHFIKPLETRNVATFKLEPQGDTTRVSWVMDGPSPYITKLMSTVFDLDMMIGADFEVGLANLKALAEK